eukprot:TRINITY_DN15_c0_g1_i3.p1 TRINITY_DN15_c0_g1~~TRINITY_DN15_c0_g1_i3.p1  ORF type:complete len:1107 (-),score=234.53 TRINITY_DN15_c0_g1_i3:134-3415(-)
MAASETERARKWAQLAQAPTGPELVNLTGAWASRGRTANLTAAGHVMLANNNLDALPAGFCATTGPTLIALTLRDNRLTSLSQDIAALKNIRLLDLGGNKLQDFPRVLCLLGRSLEVLCLDRNLLCQVRLAPSDFGLMVRLHTLHLGTNALDCIPTAITALTALKSLSLAGNHITTLPDCFAKMTSLRWLDLSNNPLRDTAPTVHLPCLKLRMDGTKLSDANWLSPNSSQQSLHFSGNSFTLIPNHFASLSSLHCLSLSYNRLSCIPQFFTALKQLRKLRLDHNTIAQVPQYITALTTLQELRLDHNQLTAYPAHVLTLQWLTSVTLDHNVFTHAAAPSALASTTPIHQCEMSAPFIRNSTRMSVRNSRRPAAAVPQLNLKEANLGSEESPWSELLNKARRSGSMCQLVPSPRIRPASSRGEPTIIIGNNAETGLRLTINSPELRDKLQHPAENKATMERFQRELIRQSSKLQLTLDGAKARQAQPPLPPHSAPPPLPPGGFRAAAVDVKRQQPPPPTGPPPAVLKAPPSATKMGITRKAFNAVVMQLQAAKTGTCEATTVTATASKSPTPSPPLPPSHIQRSVSPAATAPSQDAPYRPQPAKRNSSGQLQLSFDGSYGGSAGVGAKDRSSSSSEESKLRLRSSSDSYCKRPTVRTPPPRPPRNVPTAELTDATDLPPPPPLPSKLHSPASPPAHPVPVLPTRPPPSSPKTAHTRACSTGGSPTRAPPSPPSRVSPSPSPSPSPPLIQQQPPSPKSHTRALSSSCPPNHPPPPTPCVAASPASPQTHSRARSFSNRVCADGSANVKGAASSLMTSPKKGSAKDGPLAGSPSANLTLSTSSGGDVDDVDVWLSDKDKFTQIYGSLLVHSSSGSGSAFGKKSKSKGKLKGNTSKGTLSPKVLDDQWNTMGPDSDVVLVHENGEVLIRGATLVVLVELILATDDDQLAETFLHTFHLYTTPMELLDVLLHAFEVGKLKHAEGAIQNRVLKFLGLWLSWPGNDFTDVYIRDKVTEFLISNTSTKKPSVSPSCLSAVNRAFQKNLVKGGVVCVETDPALVARLPHPPIPLLPINHTSQPLNIQTLDILDIHPEVVLLV